MSIKSIYFALLLLFAISAECKAQQPELVVPTGHALAITNVSFSPDGKLAVTSSFENTVKIWESQSGKLLHTLNAHTA